MISSASASSVRVFVSTLYVTIIICVMYIHDMYLGLKLNVYMYTDCIFAAEISTHESLQQ